MQIDLTKPFTTNDVRELLASKDDSEHRQIRVTQAGIAYLSDQVGTTNTDGLAFRMETLCAGNGYVGQDAAKDSGWVRTVEEFLRENWPNPRCEYIDF